jgi:hypothetical protein
MRDQKITAVAPKAFEAVPSGFLSATSANHALSLVRIAAGCRGTAHAKPKRTDGFTLAELLVTTGVLVLLVFLAAQLLTTAATVTILGHKKMDADSQARQLLDRMAIDFAQMVKRSDVDYYVKSSGGVAQRIVLQPGNDQIAFYSAVPGYYPPTGSQSPVSLVSYRIYNPSPAPSPCANCNKLERMGKGLVWNAVSTTDTPVVFIPIPVASPIPAAELPSPTPNPLPTPAWPQAGNMTTDAAYELVGPQVFRFEYYYLLKNGTSSDTPWISPHTSISGMQDVSAIVVDIAVIDPKSKVLLTDAQIATLAGTLIDYGASAAAGCPTPNWQTPGELRRQWQCVLDGTNGLPRTAISGIRLYERFIYLSPPVL